MPRPTSAADAAAGAVPLRVVIVTLDSHLASTVGRVADRLRPEIPGLDLQLHAVGGFGEDPRALAACREAIASADIVVATMLFMDKHVRAVLPALDARRPHCDAMVGAMSAGEVIKLTRLGSFKMDDTQSGAIALLKKLRGASKKPNASGAGAHQMAMLKRIPKILRFIPGGAQDARAYFLTLQYWLAGSDENVANLVRLLVQRYATGPREVYRARLKADLPVEYPDVGVYHPDMAGRLSASANALPRKAGRPVVGLLLMRSYILAGNTAHYDAVIRAFDARGLDVVPAFCSGLDARAAVAAFFRADGRATIDALVSLTGFSLVGGPAYNDAQAAAATLADLDVPYLAAHAVEFQSLDQWRANERGLLPVEATMMVAIPELDGATNPLVFGGRIGAGHDMVGEPDRIARLVGRVDALIRLRRKARRQRRIAIVLFNFPPNAGSTGTAAYLSVFQSLHNTLRSLARAGYAVDVPETVDALREAILTGNAATFGAAANVHHRIPVDDHVRREPHLAEIEKQWGAAPGRHNADGRSIHVLGRAFGSAFVGVQPAFGYEGDPMRLLFDRAFTPTHAFAAFYRYVREDFRADAVLHFGTHGALEFMPGKQVGLSQACWPDRLIQDVPNIYLYAANNPSEGAIAKRRSAATLVSYLTPPLTQAGLYRGLVDLKASMTRWRALGDDLAEAGEKKRLADLIEAQARDLNLLDDAPRPDWAPGPCIESLWVKVLEYEYTLIPHGLHVVGQAATREERIDLVTAMSEALAAPGLSRAAVETLVDGATPERVLSTVPAATRDAAASALPALTAAAHDLARDTELDGLVRALDARFVPPSPSGDLVRTPGLLPTGRNIHGFDPYRMPTAFAMREGRVHAATLIDKHMADGHALPRRIAMVLWGSDNLKSEGVPIAQALALMGAAPRFDAFGRLCGAELIPLDVLKRPRIDVCVTLSGIFRDLLPLQTQMLAEAAYMAATADEPVEQNFVRAHAMADAAANGGDVEAAALRVFSNADGAYGSNVNHLIESGAWQSEDQLADACIERKGFAYGRNGKARKDTGRLRHLLKDVDLTYQNLESVELGVTTLDHYFDTLGGLSRAIQSARGHAIPVYIGDQTRGRAVVRSLNEQVALESRTRTLNPKWYEGLLAHGYEGVRQIEAHVTNTMGWSATTGQVDTWVYQQITDTFVLDPAMRERLAALNPVASARLANRLVEAHDRNYWTTDPATLDALRAAGHDLEDRVEGVAA
jgi:magnesium chelatase subunit H